MGYLVSGTLQVYSKEIATEIGLKEALVLQQIQSWLTYSKHFIDGRKWTYNTYENWQEKNFPFWSVKTVERAFLSLEKHELIIVGNYNKRNGDRTKWYSINYDKVKELEKTIDEKINQTITTKSREQQDNLSSPLPNISTNYNIIINNNRSVETSTDEIFQTLKEKEMELTDQEKEMVVESSLYSFSKEKNAFDIPTVGSTSAPLALLAVWAKLKPKDVKELGWELKVRSTDYLLKVYIAYIKKMERMPTSKEIEQIESWLIQKEYNPSILMNALRIAKEDGYKGNLDGGFTAYLFEAYEDSKGFISRKFNQQNKKEKEKNSFQKPTSMDDFLS